MLETNMLNDLSRLANKQAELAEQVIIAKFKALESKMRIRDINGQHRAFIDRLNRLNNLGYSHSTLEKFLFDVGKFGYTLSIDYLPDYSKVEYKESSATIVINPAKIQLTVTYKVISV